MKITVVYVGKTNLNTINSIVDDYIKRIKYCAIEQKVVPNVKKNCSINVQKEIEGKAIINAINNEDFLVLLDSRGNEFTSEEFATWIEKQQINRKNVVFVVGGAFGFSEEVYARANFLLSLSKMTFSHQIIRAIFAEQLYRAISIIKNEPYHHK